MLEFNLNEASLKLKINANNNVISLISLELTPIPEETVGVSNGIYMSGRQSTNDVNDIWRITLNDDRMSITVSEKIGSFDLDGVTDIGGITRLDNGDVYAISVSHVDTKLIKVDLINPSASEVVGSVYDFIVDGVTGHSVNSLTTDGTYLYTTPNGPHSVRRSLFRIDPENPSVSSDINARVGGTNKIVLPSYHSFVAGSERSTNTMYFMSSVDGSPIVRLDDLNTLRTTNVGNVGPSSGGNCATLGRDSIGNWYTINTRDQSLYKGRTSLGRIPTAVPYVQAMLVIDDG